MSHTVLVVEDDLDIRQALIEILEEHGFGWRSAPATARRRSTSSSGRPRSPASSCWT